MICKYCNAEIQDNSVICPACGKRLAKVSLLSQLYKFSEIPKRYYLCFVALLVAGVISLLSLVVMYNNDAYIKQNDAITYEVDGGATVFYYNDLEIDSEDIVPEVESISSSLHGDVVAFFDADSVRQENDEAASGVYTLYFANNNGVHQVSENVIDFRLSPNGKYIAYIDSVKELKLYNCKKDSSEDVDHNVLRENLCVSNDGDIAYLKKKTDGEYMYIYESGSSEEYFKGDRQPISVSGGVDDVFIMDSANNLYYYDGSDEVKVAADVTEYFLNEDGDHIFYHSGSKSYVYTGKSESYELSEKELSLVPCENMASFKSTGVYYGVSAFDEKYYTDTENNLYFINSDYEALEICAGVDSPRATLDGQSVVYISEEKLTVCQGEGDFTDIMDGVQSFVMKDDLRYIYFVDKNGKMFVRYGKKDPTEVASGISEYDITVDGYVFFTVEKDGKYDLYAVNGTDEPDLVCEGLSEQPKVNYTSVTYTVGEEVYASSGDLKFSKR